jgi:membrane protease YdiL (CAAX protease family)
MLIWLAVEVVIRRVGQPAIQASLARLAGVADPLPLRTPAAVMTLGLTIGVLMIIFRILVRRAGLTAAALGYRWSRGVVRAGLLSGLALFAVLVVAGAIDRAVFDPEGHTVWPRRLGGTGPLLWGALLLANGLFVPIVEEYAWRGYIQGRLVRCWGAPTGVAVTSVAFALKHVIADLSLTRVTTLAVGAVALGLIATRWGTTASTAAHAFANTAATLLVIAAANRW